MAEQQSKPDANQILIAEYQYLAQTAFQVNEDRARVAVFYLSAVGGLAVAIISGQEIARSTPDVAWAFVTLFLVLSASGLLTLLQLVRLRQAWFESVLALNRIKEYFIEHAESDTLALAFAWRNHTLPRRFKISTLSFLYVIQVAILSGLMVGAAVMFMGLAQNRLWWGAAISAGVVFTLFQLFLYWWLLRKD
jgi:hypothetical protein